MRMVHLISSFVCLSRPARGLLFSPRATPASVPLARHMHVHWSRLHVRSLSTTTTSGGSEGRVVSSWSGPPAQPPVDREGEVVIQQEDLPLQLDVLALEEVLRRLLKLTGCAHMDVGVSLTNDANIKELNAIYRGKPKATDVLSFPNHDAFAIDGDFPGDPDTFAQTEDDMNLGDMVVSVPYVLRCMQDDSLEAKEVGATEWALDRKETRGVSGAMMGYLGQDCTSASATRAGARSAATAVKAAEVILVDGDDGLTLAAAAAAPLSEAAAPSPGSTVVEDNDASGKPPNTNSKRLKSRELQPLSTAQTEALQARVSLLLAHGLLHLLGHDHEHSATPIDEDENEDGDDEESEEDRDGSDHAQALNADEDARVEAMYEIMVAEEERLVEGIRDLLPPEE